MDLFLYGTLLHPDLFALIAGPGPGVYVSATLPGYAVDRERDGVLPMIVVRPGAQAQGTLWRGLSEAQQARLDAYEVPFGYALRPVSVVLADGTGVQARSYFPPEGQAPSGEPWSLAEWTAADGPITLEAATEIATNDPPLPAADLVRQWPMIRHRASARVRAGQAAAPAVVRRTPGAAPAGQAPRILFERGRAGGFYKLRTLDIDHPTFDNATSDPLTRDVFVGVDAAIVLPYDPVRDRVLLVEQFRVGPFVRGDRNPWMLEPVAGLIDAGETPEQAAHREAREEAALTFSHLEEMFQMYPSPGGSTDHFHCFAGLADLPDLGVYHGGLPEEHEDLRLHVLPFDDAFALIQSGEAQVGPLIAMLLWLAANRARWRTTA